MSALLFVAGAGAALLAAYLLVALLAPEKFS